MKKTIIFCSLICWGLLVFSCKKGEDDPAFTLATRKARVEGTWRLETGSMKLQYEDATNKYADDLYSFKDGSYEYIQTGKAAQYNGSHELTLVCDKKGRFSFKQVINSSTFDASGTWNFQGKVGEDKNKERISFHLDNITGATNKIDLFNKSIIFFSYKIKELRKDKMVLTSEKEFINSEKSGLKVYVTAEYVFVQ